MILQHFKKIFTFLFIVLPGFVLAQSGNSIPEKPDPPRLITDFTLTLNQQEINALEQKLDAYNDSTSSQIAIVVVKNLGDYEISQYAFDLALKWGIGQKGKNNGLLILWSVGDRKVFIATGYGFEEKVPDAVCKQIVDQLIIPNFRLGAFYSGLDLATNEIISRMSGTFEADSNQGQGEIPLSVLLLIMVIILIIIIVIAYLFNKYGKGGGRNNGNNGGGLLNNIPWWLISNSGGSRWGGGGSWGGGGGGFGGFGGGSFGGGGAGGSY